jgi:hypothetical protein
MRKSFAVFVMVAVAVTGSTPILAQAQGQGTLSGVAQSADKAPLPNYRVHVRNANTGTLAGQTLSNQAGQFTFTSLQPASYVVELVDAAGKVVGLSPSLTVAAGSTVTVTVGATAAGALAAASGGGLSLLGLGPLASVAVVGAASAAAVTAVVATREGKLVVCHRVSDTVSQTLENTTKRCGTAISLTVTRSARAPRARAGNAPLVGRPAQGSAGVFLSFNNKLSGAGSCAGRRGEVRPMAACGEALSRRRHEPERRRSLMTASSLRKFGLALAALSLPVLAHAQSAGDAEQIDQVRHDARSHLGPFYVTPKISLRELGVDSNVFNAGGEADSDFTATVTPSADIWVPVARRLLLRTTVGADLVWYANFRTERSIDPQVAERAELYLRRITLFVEGAYRNTRQRLNYEVDLRARHIEEAAGGRCWRCGSRRSSRSKRPAAWTTSGSTATPRRRHQPPAHVEPEDDRVRGCGAPPCSQPLTTLALRYEQIEDAFAYSPDRDSKSFRVMPGNRVQAPRAHQWKRLCRLP